MKKSLTLLSLISFFCISAQVAFGKSTVSNLHVSLEFEIGNKALVLPWVNSSAMVFGVVNETMIYDTIDYEVKYLKNGVWTDLSVDTTGYTDTTLQENKVELIYAKVVIGTNASNDITPGILVLSDTDKAPVLPKMASPHLNIINLELEMMAYDKTSHQVAGFNGSN